MKKRTNQILIGLTAALLGVIVYCAGLREIRVLRAEEPFAGALLKLMNTRRPPADSAVVLNEEGRLELPWGIWQKSEQVALPVQGRVWMLSTPTTGQRVYRIVDGGIDAEDTVDLTLFQWSSLTAQRDL